MKIALTIVMLSLFVTSVFAAPVTYLIDPTHTYPSVEVDHMGGLSIWRGKFTRSSGTIVLDRDTSSGTLEVTVETSSIDFGQEKLDQDVQADNFLGVVKYPIAIYKGVLTNFRNGAPTEVQGNLTLHGITRPLVLRINQFLCKPHPITRKEVCGADASGSFDRADYGMSFGRQFGWKTAVKLAIQVEAVRRS